MLDHVINTLCYQHTAPVKSVLNSLEKTQREYNSSSMTVLLGHGTRNPKVTG